jgi:(heptosyl)LPS beta-1,4-glucosyltransferase
MAPRISAVINTFNEEHNLPYALRSVKPWVDEIIVVDMHSDDRTAEIAHSFGAEVYFHDRLGFADPARAFAASKATGEWILILDADELIPQPLSHTLIAVACEGSADVVSIPRLSYYFGAPMMHAGSGPERCRQLRFFKRSSLTLTGDVHNYAHPVPGSRLLPLPYMPGQAIIHFPFVDYSDWAERMNRYTTIEACQLQARGRRANAFRALAKSLRVFLDLYIRDKGYRDGWRGLYFSLGSAFYVVAVHAKLTQLLLAGPRERTVVSYQAEAERILGGYGKE